MFLKAHQSSTKPEAIQIHRSEFESGNIVDGPSPKTAIDADQALSETDAPVSILHFHNRTD